MKKIALTIAILLGISLCSQAQGNGLFGYGETNEEESVNTAWYSFYQDQEVDNGLFSLFRSGLSLPGLPGHGSDTNEPAPLGSGALLLIGFGTAYAAAKRRKK